MGARAAVNHPGRLERAQVREATPGPTEQQLEDALYDILAVGVDPTAEPRSLEAVQRFVHEHARSRRTHAELLAFFERHGLPYLPERHRAAAPQFVLPPVEPALAVGGFEPVPVSAHAAGSAQRASRAPWFVVAGAIAAVVVVVAAGAFAHVALSDMRAELARVRSESTAQARDLSLVQADAAALRSATQENSDLMRKVDRKSDVLIQSLLSPLDPSQR